MNILIVVDDPDDWPLRIPNVSVVPARQYLTNRQYTEMQNTLAFSTLAAYSAAYRKHGL